MPEITAEELVKKICAWGACIVLDRSQWGHIIACLREHEERAAGEMAQYLTDAREFSSRTFGPGKRTGGVTQHIEKELSEIREKPDDLTEWVDVIILACDGYWRHGGQPENLMADIRAKLEKNKRRVWPTPTSEDVAVEHDRTHDDPLNPELGPEHREYWVRKAAVEKAVRNA